jgi:PAS domain-containing protein
MTYLPLWQGRDSQLAYVGPLGRDPEPGSEAFILENVSDAISAVERDHNIALWNQGAEVLYGWKVEKVIGRPDAWTCNLNCNSLDICHMKSL